MFQEQTGGFCKGIIFSLFIFLSGGGVPAFAADNAECLQCHRNPRLSKGAKDGSLLSLYVNEEAFTASVHGMAGVGCTECHAEAQTTFHPASGFPAPNCAGCHPEAAEAFQKTTHGMLLESGSEKAPRCQDCHTAHYVRKQNDPQSPVNAAHLPATCAQCHEEATPPKGFFTALATYRLAGHRKVNMETRFDTQGCANCHPENTGHPQEPGKPSACLKCHDRSADTPLLSGPIHFKMSFTEQPVLFVLRFIYGTGLVILIIGGISYFAYRTYRRRKARTEDTESSREEKRAG